jgi:hypothetical protein
MTDAGQKGTEWVPRFGMLEVSSERAALIRGLFELAAFVADHPELPLPGVQASFYTGTGGWQAKQAVVDQVAAALGKPAADRPGVGFYEVQAMFGPVRVKSTAITAESMAQWEATVSYDGRVQPAARRGHMDAAATVEVYGGEPR